MHENGADLATIQIILGHEKTETTQIYARTSLRRLLETHNNTHPAERDEENGRHRNPIRISAQRTMSRMLLAPKNSGQRSPRQRAHARGGDRRRSSAAFTCVSTTACRVKRTCTYETRARLESCSRDPVGYRGSPWNLYEYVGGNPGVFVDPSGKACVLGEEATVVLAIGAFDALKASECRHLANRVSRASGLPGPRNGKQDAFRHCFWNCCMAARIGAGQAKEVADIHEECNPGSAAETVMDLYNNKIGRTVRPTDSCCKGELCNCEAGCLIHGKNGTLQNAL